MTPELNSVVDQAVVNKRPPQIPPGAHRCKACHGLGQIAWGHAAGSDPGGEKTYCPDCDGNGWVKRDDEVKPLAGQGNA